MTSLASQVIIRRASVRSANTVAGAASSRISFRTSRFTSRGAATSECPPTAATGSSQGSRLEIRPGPDFACAMSSRQWRKTDQPVRSLLLLSGDRRCRRAIWIITRAMESAILRAHDGPEGEACRAWCAPTDSHAQPENGLGDVDCTVFGRPLCDLFRQNSWSRVSWPDVLRVAPSLTLFAAPGRPALWPIASVVTPFSSSSTSPIVKWRVGVFRTMRRS